MRSKAWTIKKRSEFVRIGKQGARAKTCALIVLCLRSANKDSLPSVGYTASKKVGNAVMRNRAKRRMRSLVHIFKSAFVPGYSFVFIATTDTVPCEFSKLQSDFLFCVKKAMERADAC